MRPGTPGIAGRRRRIDRSWFVRMHRWVGLMLAGFLLLAGLTGALLAWYDELDAAISPGLLRVVPPTHDTQPIDPLVLFERVQAAYPWAVVSFARLSVRPGHALVMPLSPRAGAADLPNDQVFVDPYTGQVLGERKWGALSQGSKNLMPFIYRLHYQLALGVVGSYAFGVVALLWTIDCFVGACLSLPAARREQRRRSDAAGAKSWPARWWPSWKVRWTGGSYKLNFDLHRAGGLWAWVMLLVLAWSAVAFNLPAVYEPVTKAVLSHQPSVNALPARPAQEPAIGWHEARELGRRLMDEQAREKGFAVLAEDTLMLDRRTGTYRYDVISTRDVAHRWGSTRVVFDADTGAFRGLWLPTGAASGDTVTTWLTSLHMAAVGGWPMKILVCGMGLLVATLSVTGIFIWQKKRQGRRRVAAGRPAQHASGGAGPR